MPIEKTTPSIATPVYTPVHDAVDTKQPEQGAFKRTKLPTSLSDFNIQPLTGLNIGSKSPNGNNGMMDSNSLGIPPAEGSSYNAFILPRPRSSSLNKMAAPPFRRPSMLASSSVITPTMDDDSDDEMALDDQDDQVEIIPASSPTRMNLRSPFFPSAVPNRFQEYSRSASTSNLSTLGQQQPEIVMDQSKAFNPLNPAPVMQPAGNLPLRPATPSTPFSKYNKTHSLQRAKSSPSLRLVESTNTPAASFSGLGVMLPDTSTSPVQSVHSDLASPILARGPVRRAVVRRGSLMVTSFKSGTRNTNQIKPKPKHYMRVQAQLNDEHSPHADAEEMLSEAALHRLHTSHSSRPNSVAIPALRSTSASFGLYPTIGPRGWHNRFPEAAPDDDDWEKRRIAGLQTADSTDSDEFEADLDVLDGMQGQLEDAGSVSQADMDDDGNIAGSGSAVRGVDIENWRKERETWLEFRSPNNLPSFLSRQPNPSSNIGMEAEPTLRPNKRKMTDEPFSALTFKRRAVSPTSSLSPALGSPAALSNAHPVATFWPRSRQGSPAPSMASTTMSSFGGGPPVSGALLGQFLKRDKERTLNTLDVENDMAMLL